MTPHNNNRPGRQRPSTFRARYGTRASNYRNTWVHKEQSDTNLLIQALQEALHDKLDGFLNIYGLKLAVGSDSITIRMPKLKSVIVTPLNGAITIYYSPSSSSDLVRNNETVPLEHPQFLERVIMIVKREINVGMADRPS